MKKIILLVFIEYFLPSDIVKRIVYVKYFFDILSVGDKV